MKIPRFIFCVSIFLAFLFDSCFAVSFDLMLKQVGALRKTKKYSDLAALLKKSSASPELEDLRLFLLAESQKSTGNNEEARKNYQQLLEKFPETETAYQARLPHFLLLLEIADKNSVSKLEVLARVLPTQWQRATAFEKLAALPFLNSAEMSGYLYNAVKEHHSEKPFYKTIPGSHDLLRKLLKNPENYSLTGEQWLELLILAGEEGLLKDLLSRNPDRFSRILSGWPGILEVFKAIAIGQKNGQTDAITALSGLLNKPGIHGSVKNFVFQQRANLYYQSQNFAAAMTDFKMALQKPDFPVNRRACQYRLMRSAFSAGRDAEALEVLGHLIKEGEPEPLLPIQLYEMGLERYDAGKKQIATLYFMALARSFPGHYRADDALGYGIFSLGTRSNDGKTLLKLLQAKYSNSFFLTWVAPELKVKPVISGKAKAQALSDKTRQRVAAWKKLWNTDFASFSREEARKLTDKYPAHLSLYEQIIKICREAEDYNQLIAYGERLARQLLETGKSMSDMPLWGWQALYPEAYFNLVKNEAKKNSIDPYWVLSIMREESHFNPETLSRSNAHGLMQILPSTGKWIAGKLGIKGFTKNQLWKPEINIRFGCWYLKYLYDLFNAELHLASAAYNGGQGNIQRKVEAGPFKDLAVLERLDRVPLPETRDYYKKVMGSYWNYTRLYSGQK